MVTRGAQFGALGLRPVAAATTTAAARSAVFAVLVISLVVYAISFLLLRLLSRYRELCADRAGAYLTQKPAALANALTKISGQMNAVPERDLRAAQPMNAFFIAPAMRGLSLGTLTATHPPLEQRLDQLAKIAAEPRARPADVVGFWDVLRGHSRTAPAKLDALFALPSAALTLEASLGLHPPAAARCASARRRAAPPCRRSRRLADLVAVDGGPQTESRVDEFGYTWLTVRTDPPDVGALVTDLHAVNSALEAQGFGPGCSARPSGFRVGERTSGSSWSTSTSRAPSTRSAPAGPPAATPCWSARSATPSAPTCRSRRTPARWMPIWGLS